MTHKLLACEQALFPFDPFHKQRACSQANKLQ